LRNENWVEKTIKEKEKKKRKRERNGEREKDRKNSTNKQTNKHKQTSLGTVLYTTKSDHSYSSKIETREEGGTPDIIGSIRAGLVFQVKINMNE